MKIKILDRELTILTTPGLLNRIYQNHDIDLRREDGEEVRAMLSGEAETFWKVVMCYLRINVEQQNEMADAIDCRELAILTAAIVRSLSTYFRSIGKAGLAALIESFLATLQTARWELAKQIPANDTEQAETRAALLLNINEELDRAIVA